MKKLLEGLIYIWLIISSMATGSEVALGMARAQENRQYARGELKRLVDEEREFLQPEWLSENFHRAFDDVEVVINTEVQGSGHCYYASLKKEVHFNYEYDEYWEALVIGKRCIAHEVGHYIDQLNGYPSGTDEFHEAVDLAAKMDWGIAHWPCLYGNECLDGYWGGYGELYADLFARKSLGDIPANLWPWYQEYFR